MAKKIFRGEGLFGAITVGGSTVAGIKTGTLNFTLGTIGAGTTGTVEAALAGVEQGDIIMLMPENPVNGVGLGGAMVSAAGTVEAYWVNGGDSAAAAGTVTARYLHIDFT